MRPLPKTLARLKSIEERVTEIQQALRESPLPPKSLINREDVMAEKKVKKVVKKATKVSKAPAKKKAETSSDVVTLAELAEEAGISPQRARQKLREAEFVREGRWTWEKGDKSIAKVKEILTAGSDEE